MPPTDHSCDVLILGATPGGIACAVAAAEAGRSVILLERETHIGGLPANGLGATDIGTRGGTTGFFLRFVREVKRRYVATYGEDSPQVRDCDDGYHFEPSMAEAVLSDFLAAESAIQVYTRRQFDWWNSERLLRNDQGQACGLLMLNRDSGAVERYQGTVLIDATYEGDLAAACGAPFAIGREAPSAYGEAVAGQLYQPWAGSVHSLGRGDDRIQAYNYRLCLTRDSEDRVPFTKPADYNPEEYESLIDDVAQQRWTGTVGSEIHLEGIGRLTNMVIVPNGKSDANNQHLAFISTDLPEENQDWPTATWEWRDAFAQRLRSYIEGLFYFATHDPRLAESFRQSCAEWGWSRSEYSDNGHFPRQVYVREGRRIQGDHFFTAGDCLPLNPPEGRPPVHSDSVTASHYSLDSHACHKREAGKPHLEGFLNTRCKPYTVPYGVMLPKNVDGLLCPVPVSGSHIGFSTLRMEPCWMALGEAAGVAAALSITLGISPRSLPLPLIQQQLLKRGAMLIYVRDIPPEHPLHAGVQRLALLGLVPEWDFHAEAPIDADTAQRWAQALGKSCPSPLPASRGELIAALSA